MKLKITLLLFCFSLSAFAKEKVVSTVDQRVELLAVIFRLAGNPEYNMHFAKNYVADIHTYFDSYSSHPAILFAKQLAADKNIGFSKVMYLAVAMTYKDGHFALASQSENSLAGKWHQEDAVKLVQLADEFYQATKFETFFKAHHEMYLHATTEFNNSLASFDEDWYFNYYGDHEVQYHVILGLSDGGGNYGPAYTPPGQKRQVYAIMGSWTFDQSGTALFPQDIYLSYLVHEFNHSFTDHLLMEDGNEAALQASGEKLLAAEREAMDKEGYDDWHSLINESLVRASVVRYMMDHHAPDQDVQAEIQKQTTKGFLWTKAMVALLGEYESSRDKYPTFKSFYPRVITFFDNTATQIN
jgi:hypothetical protein